MHSFQKDKFPNPYGWPIEFFLRFYELIEEDILKVIEKSRVSGKVLVARNTTFLIMIPLTKSVDSFEYLRLYPYVIQCIKLFQRSYLED